MHSLRVAAIQLNSQPDVNYNLAEIYKWVEQAAEKNAKLICLPENFAFMGDEKERLRQADKISKRVDEQLSEWAQKAGATILAGGYPVPAENGKVFNRSALFSKTGKIVATYDKIHLFDVSLSKRETYIESDMVQPGREVVVEDLPESGFKIGLSVCYDIRFPELYRTQAAKGANILTVPSAFTKPTGKAHWETLLRARAIENQSYMIAPAQTGKHGKKRETFGHSMIIDPWGAIFSKTETEPGIITAELEMDVLRDVRKKLPSLNHRVL